MHKMLRVVVAALFVLVLCPAARAQEKIVIAGSGDSQMLLRHLADIFEKEHPGVSVDVPDSVGSSGGIKALLAGACDLARLARPLQDSEKEAGVSERVFALAPVVFVASGDVGDVRGLTREQVVAVYSGKISSWAEVGGPESALFVASREKGDSSRRIIEAHIPAFGQISSPAGEIVYTTPELVEIFQTYGGVLGYAPLSMVHDAGLTVMALDGVAPTPENVSRGTYPMVLSLSVAWMGSLSGPGREFVDFLFTPRAAEAIRSCGAVSPEDAGR
jgi:phosphate transport system substrate-binding protein